VNALIGSHHSFTRATDVWVHSTINIQIRWSHIQPINRSPHGQQCRLMDIVLIHFSNGRSAYRPRNRHAANQIR
jgi:hypothetical protein